MRRRLSRPPGRHRECVRLEGVLDRIGEGSTAALLIRGEPGIGKTTLLDFAAAAARSRGMRVLRAGGAAGETAFRYAVLLELLRPHIAELEAIPPHQAQALRSAIGLVEPAAGSGANDRFMVGAALLSLLTATEQPTVILLDDVQWVDAASLEAVAFAVRRSGFDSLGLLMAARDTAAVPRGITDTDELLLAGLPEDAISEIVDDVAPQVARSLARETGGNPLACLQAALHLTAEQRSGAADLPTALPAGQRLDEVFEQSLCALDEPALRLLTLAALNREEHAAPVLAAIRYEGGDPDELLVRLGRLVVHEDPVLRLQHPLLRSAILRRARADQVRSAHASLAAVAVDARTALWHRSFAIIGFDDSTALALAAQAESDEGGAGYAAAASALERAAAITGDPQRRDQWHAMAAQNAAHAGQWARARRLIGYCKHSPWPWARGTALSALAAVELADGTYLAAANALQGAVGLTTGVDRLRALVELVHIAYLRNDPGLAADAARAAAADPSDPEQRMLAHYVRGASAVFSGRPDLGRDEMLAAVSLLDTEPFGDDPLYLLPAMLSARWLLDFSGGDAHSQRRIWKARQRAAFGPLSMALSFAAGASALQGDHQRAYALAGEAAEMLEALGTSNDPGQAYDLLAIELAGRGLHDRAAEALRRARQAAKAEAGPRTPPHVSRAIARCALAAGDLPTVIETHEALIAAGEGYGWLLEPLGVAPELIEAYVASDRLPDARAMLARYWQVQQENPGYPGVAALVARCEGLVAEDATTAAAAYERALALHGATVDYEAARTRMLYGMMLRRSGSRVAARAELQQAERDFDAMGLTGLADTCRAELAATGARRTPAGSGEPLTSQETRVAMLAAQGLSNREVAQALFLSPKTVEHHIGSVFRKRGLRRRTQLVALFAGPGNGEGGD